MADDRDRSEPEAPSQMPTEAYEDETLASEVALALGLEVSKDIGDFKILELLGEGGMGAVYLAEQESPRRKVALKVVRSGFATPAMLARFEHEAELLGRLQHRGIAQIFQAGTADTGTGGQPYFVMEYIRGKPLVDYVEEQALSVRERLGLFIKICEAVHHAHQKGVIHRDLKPGNILVTEEGQPKILDFGVARATDSDIAVTTVLTNVGELVGTVPYMSPEQAGGDPRKLDVRSDVYSLGVVVYQLLTGRLPYDLQRKAIHEAVRIIREEDPTPPSTVTSGIPSDVETILLKTLEKESERRYQSASELATEVGRFLRDEPIAARPPSVAYQLAKFARRNRVLVGSLAAVFGVMAIATVVSIGFAVEAREQRDVAQTQAAKAEAIVGFMSDMFSSIDPSVSLGREVTVREIVDQASEDVDRNGLASPEVEAAVRGTLGTTYRGLAQFAASESHLRKSLDLLADVEPARELDEATMRFELASTLYYLENIDEAEQLLNEVAATRERLLGEHHPDTLRAVSNAAIFPVLRGDIDRGIEILEEVTPLLREHAGPLHEVTLENVHNLGEIYFRKGEIERSRTLFQEAYDGRVQVLGELDPETLNTGNSLAGATSLSGDREEAERLWVKTVEGMNEVMGGTHMITLAAKNGLATLLAESNRVGEAIEIMEEVVAHMREIAPGVQNTLIMTSNLGALKMKAGQYQEAEGLLSESLEGAQATMPEGHFVVAFFASRHGACLGRLGQFERGEAELLPAIESLRQTLGDQHRYTQLAIVGLVDLYSAWGRAGQEATWRALLVDAS